jgi:hypothetical protein
MNENLISFLQQRFDLFPYRKRIDMERFLQETYGETATLLPVPSKIFLLDEVAPHSFGFPVMRSRALDDLDARLAKWLERELRARSSQGEDSHSKLDESFRSYVSYAVSIAGNAIQSSILADYHGVFWLVHSQQVARQFAALPRAAMSSDPRLTREQADALKYLVFAKWAQAIRESVPEIEAMGSSAAGSTESTTVRFLRLLLDNVLIFTEEFVGPDLRELRTFFAGSLRRDFAAFRALFDGMQREARDLLQRDPLLRRGAELLGIEPDASLPLAVLFDHRFQRLLESHAAFNPVPTGDRPQFEAVSRRVLDFLLLHQLRRGMVWMKVGKDGENRPEEQGSDLVFSRAIRPMNFGRRGIVDPMVYRYGLVYDITSFTESLGQIVRGGKDEEQGSYRQMLEFQRELAEIAQRNGLQFEKFLGDGAFYTARRALRVLLAAIDIQQFYSSMRRSGFAFDKGMRIALNYGYYRLLPMQVSTGGAEVMEFYGPGIVELSRLTTGKATKEVEDMQHLLLSHGYDQLEVMRFFAPLSRDVDTTDAQLQQREFYAYVNASGHLINEGVVVSIPFLKQLSAEIDEEDQKLYRFRTSWGSYIGFASQAGGTDYVALRILGAVSLKGIGSIDVGEAIALRRDDAEISVIDQRQPLVKMLRQERNRSSAGQVHEVDDDWTAGGGADLVVCASSASAGSQVILVGEWDPVSQEIRRPIQIDEEEVERYGLAVPLSVTGLETQRDAYHSLYRKLSRIETLTSFSVGAVRDNNNFQAFLIGAHVEAL